MCRSLSTTEDSAIPVAADRFTGTVSWNPEPWMFLGNLEILRNPKKSPHMPARADIISDQSGRVDHSVIT